MTRDLARDALHFGNVGRGQSVEAQSSLFAARVDAAYRTSEWKWTMGFSALPKR